MIAQLVEVASALLTNTVRSHQATLPATKQAKHYCDRDGEASSKYHNGQNVQDHSKTDKCPGGKPLPEDPLRMAQLPKGCSLKLTPGQEEAQPYFLGTVPNVASTAVRVM